MRWGAKTCARHGHPLLVALQQGDVAALEAVVNRAQRNPDLFPRRAQGGCVAGGRGQAR